MLRRADGGVGEGSKAGMSFEGECRPCRFCGLISEEEEEEGEGREKTWEGASVVNQTYAVTKFV
jgi:hypothetical protein